MPGGRLGGGVPVGVGDGVLVVVVVVVGDGVRVAVFVADGVFGEACAPW